MEAGPDLLRLPAVLRHAWFNLDRLWAAALITAGTITVLTAL